jgi:rfaE bifunctional protein nucleotidyltransferase chain/domain
MSRAKIFLDARKLAKRLAAERARGRTLVFANGCFDVLHVGHVRYLQAASEEGNTLVVAVNTDASYRRNRGRNPVIPQRERYELIAAIGCVDYVVPLPETTADRLIRLFRPHVHAKGTDYRPSKIAERATVEEVGGRIAIVGDPKNHSTTEILSRIRSANHSRSKRR